MIIAFLMKGRIISAPTDVERDYWRRLTARTLIKTGSDNLKKKFYNGNFYISEGVFASSILVESGKIIAVDSSEEGDENIDLKGATVIPGLNDSHLHLHQTGQALNRVDLSIAKSIDEVIRLTRDFMKDHPKDFFYGRGWNHDYFQDGEVRLLDRHDLDKISRDVPIMLERVCGHVAAVNSKAIEFMEMYADMRVEGGEIRLGKDGLPNGIITENALAYVKEFIPKERDSEIKSNILQAMDYAVSKGVTSVGSTDYYSDGYIRTVSIITDIYKKGEHKLRYDPQFNFQSMDGLEDYYNNYYLDNSLYNDRYTRGALKVFKDGSLGARTAMLRKNYKDDPSAFGTSAIDNEVLEEMLAFCEKNSIRMIVHAIGDRAVEGLINIYSKGMQKGNPNRHGIVHCQISDLDQLKRIAENKIYVYYQPVFLQYDIMIIEDRVGKELARTSYAFKTMQDLDPTLVSYGTDAPVEDLNPFENIYHAVTRQRRNGFPEGGFYPEERVSVSRSIDAYTIGSAYSQGLEDVKGRIKEGHFADFVVLDRDIFTCPVEEIKDIKPLATYIGGEEVYGR